MFLEELEINSKDGIIRTIPFQNGLNLIIDKSPISLEDTSSGNSVGKTTVLRAIDFCFGSDGKDFYVDKEFDIENLEVKNFLLNKGVFFTLKMAIRNKKLILVRSFNNEYLRVK